MGFRKGPQHHAENAGRKRDRALGFSEEAGGVRGVVLGSGKETELSDG